VHPNVCDVHVHSAVAVQSHTLSHVACTCSLDRLHERMCTAFASTRTSHDLYAHIHDYTHTHNLTLRPMVQAVDADIKDDEKAQLAQSNMTMRCRQLRACMHLAIEERAAICNSVNLSSNLMQSYWLPCVAGGRTYGLPREAFKGKYHHAELDLRKCPRRAREGPHHSKQPWQSHDAHTRTHCMQRCRH
jgi:hypothetical protein